MINYCKEKINQLRNNEKFMELFIYGIFGVLATIVNLGSFELLKIIFPTVNVNILNIFSIIIAILFAYFTNRTYVFKSKTKNILKEFIAFLGSRAFSAIFEVITFYILTELLHWNDRIAKLIVTFFVIIINYILSKLIVFKKKSK